MNAVGEDDPTYPACSFSNQLRQATTSFIKRAERRIGWRKPNHKKNKRVSICCKLRQGHSCGFRSRVGTIEILVAERERDELRAQFHSNVRSEERERKQPRNLSSNTLELILLSLVAVGQSGQVQRGVGGDSFSDVETLIDCELRFRSVNRFNHCWQHDKECPMRGEGRLCWRSGTFRLSESERRRIPRRVLWKCLIQADFLVQGTLRVVWRSFVICLISPWMRLLLEVRAVPRSHPSWTVSPIISREDARKLRMIWWRLSHDHSVVGRAIMCVRKRLLQVWWEFCGNPCCARTHDCSWN